MSGGREDLTQRTQRKSTELTEKSNPSAQPGMAVPQKTAGPLERDCYVKSGRKLAPWGMDVAKFWAMVWPMSARVALVPRLTPDFCVGA